MSWSNIPNSYSSRIFLFLLHQQTPTLQSLLITKFVSRPSFNIFTPGLLNLVVELSLSSLQFWSWSRSVNIDCCDVPGKWRNSKSGVADRHNHPGRHQVLYASLETQGWRWYSRGMCHMLHSDSADLHSVPARRTAASARPAFLCATRVSPFRRSTHVGPSNSSRSKTSPPSTDLRRTCCCAWKFGLSKWATFVDRLNGSTIAIYSLALRPEAMKWKLDLLVVVAISDSCLLFFFAPIKILRRQMHTTLLNRHKIFIGRMAFDVQFNHGFPFVGPLTLCATYLPRFSHLTLRYVYHPSSSPSHSIAYTMLTLPRRCVYHALPSHSKPKDIRYGVYSNHYGLRIAFFYTLPRGHANIAVRFYMLTVR